MIIRFILLAILLLTVPAALRAQTQPATAPSLAEARAYFDTATGKAQLPGAELKRLETLVTQLGAEDWAVRDAAERTLKTEQAAIPLLQRALSSSDLEVVTRTRRLLQILQARDPLNLALLQAALATRVAARDTAVIDDLILLLDSMSPTARYVSEYGLRRLTGQKFAYNSFADLATREAGAKAVQQWWAKGKDKFVLQAPPRYGLLLAVASGEAKFVALFDDSGELIWKRPLPYAPSSAVGLANGNLLVGSSDSPGVATEYDPTGKAVWSTADLKLTHKGGIADLERLANGNTLLALPNDFMLVQVDATGTMPWLAKHLQHPYAIQPLPNGNTLVLERLSNQVSELSPAKAVVRAMEGLNTPTDARSLANGNVLITEFDGRRIMEIDSKGTVVWRSVTQGNPSSVERLPDGSTAYAAGQEGLVIVGFDGKIIRRPLGSQNSRWGKVRLVSEAFLQAQTKKP